ncbi:MAG: DUF4340 domain-containing protein [bacterium]
MNYKKTIILIIILCLLIGIAYLINRSPKKTSREMALFPEFDAEKVTTIRLNGKTNKLTLIKTDGQWLATEEEDLPADKDQIKQALDVVSELKRDDIISKNPSKQEIFQVDPNQGFEVEIKGEGDTTLALFYIGKNGPDFMSTYVRKADSDEVILYKGFHLRSRFDKPAENWLDKFIIIVQDEDVEAINYNRDDGSFSLVKDFETEKWRLDQPEASAVREKVMSDITQTLFNLRGTKLRRLKPELGLEEFGLDQPSLSITLSMTDGDSKTLLIGKQDEKTDEYFVRLSDRDIVYSVAKFSIDKINKTWQELKMEEAPPEASQQTDLAINPNMPPPTNHP